MRVCWVYLLKEKSDVENVFKTFYNMVATQFNTKIQVLRSDDGREYIAQTIGSFFKKKGIFHQTPCNDIPPKNGIAERKNRHILEVTCALLFSTKMPTYNWGETVLHATYLINRIPTRVLNLETPINKLQWSFSHFLIISYFAFQNIWCTIFMQNPNRQADKLDPRAKMCLCWNCTDSKRLQMF